MRTRWLGGIILMSLFVTAVARASDSICPIYVPLEAVSRIVTFTKVSLSSTPTYDQVHEALIAGTRTGKVASWSVADGKRGDDFFSLADGRVEALSAQPQGRYVALRTPSGFVLVIDLNDKSKRIPLTLAVEGADASVPLRAWDTLFSPDGKLLLIDYRNADAVFDVETPALSRLNSRTYITETLNDRSIRATRFSPNSRFLAQARSDGSTLIFNARNGDRVGVIPSTAASDPDIRPAQAFSPEGDLYLVCKRYADITRPGGTIENFEVFEMQWPDLEYVNAPNANVGTRLRQYQIRHHQEPDFYSVPLFIGKGRMAIPDQDGNVRIVNARTGDRIKLLEVGQNHQDYPNPVIEMALSPDGKALATGSLWGSICVWNVDDYRGGHCRLDGRKSPILFLDFTPDGKYLIAATINAQNDPNYLIINRETLRAQTVTTSQ